MRFVDLPKELQTGAELTNGLLQGTDHIAVAFEKADQLTLRRDGDVLVIGYSRKAEALRGMSMAKRFWENPVPVSQKAKFDTLTLMADCSRNAVPNPESLKKLMVHLAMMGFTSLMLYTEDTYEIPGEPYFGHMRGRYTVQELQELDAFGAEIGIELIPCIQTLAHLNAIFNWTAYNAVHDIDDILLAEDEKTYALIDQMLKAARTCFRSRYINIGMDEAHHLGRGAYTDRFGYSEKAQIMLKHLDKVVTMCKKYDFEPVMWSDMFFRMQFNGLYNVPEGELSEPVISKIPEDVALCYWNYYTPPKHQAMLRHMFQQHARTNRQLWFAGGSWSWSGYTPKNYFSNQVTPLQLNMAKEFGVKNVIATAWGDDGGECSVWNILPSLLQYAELCYGDADAEVLEQRSVDCFGIAYSEFMKLDKIGVPKLIDESRSRPPCAEKMALFNDVLMGIVDTDLAALDLTVKYAEDLKALEAVPENRFELLFDVQRRLAELLVLKTDLSAKIKKAYRAKDQLALERIVNTDLAQVERCLERYHEIYRQLWHKVNKPFGFEVQDMRLGGLKARLATARIRLQGYLDGRIAALEELEQPDLPLRHTGPSDDNPRWKKSATASVMAW